MKPKEYKGNNKTKRSLRLDRKSDVHRWRESDFSSSPFFSRAGGSSPQILARYPKQVSQLAGYKFLGVDVKIQKCKPRRRERKGKEPLEP